MSSITEILELLFIPSKSSHVNSAYHLKHVFENYVGYYISAEDFEILLKQNGYKLTKKGCVYGTKSELAKSYY